MLYTSFIRCPFCGEKFEAVVDTSAGDADYIEDCAVCCQPIHMYLTVDDDGKLSELRAESDD